MKYVTAGTLRLPARIHFGYGARAQLSEVLRPSGRCVLAIVDPFLIETPIFRETITKLETDGFDVAVHSDISPELPIASLDAAAAFAREYAPTSSSPSAAAARWTPRSWSACSPPTAGR